MSGKLSSQQGCFYPESSQRRLRKSRHSMQTASLTVVFAASLLMSGCLLKRSDYQVPTYPLPEKIVSPSAQPASSGPETTVDMTVWWHVFDSAELNALMQRALANNADIRLATLHAAEAKIRSDQAHGARLPSLDASVAAGPQHGSAPSATTSGASLTGSYTIDVWGEQAAAAEEADYQLWQAEFEVDNTKRVVTANLAASYIDYLTANDRIKTARLTEKILAELATTIDRRTAVGDATLLELEQQRSAVYSERALVPGLELQRDNALSAITAQLGTLPEALQLSDADLTSIHVPEQIPQIPSRLLAARADVRSMEARLLASDVDIDVMRARLLPSFNLTAQTGYSGLLAQLIGPKSFFWNMFTNVTTNVFDAGKHAADIEQARLVHEEMLTEYGKTLLQAVREVESALNAIQSSAQRMSLQQEALLSANRAWGISNKMYAVGGADFMALQDTERTYRRYVEDSLQLRSDYYHGYITLFQSLGGATEVAPDAEAIVWQAQSDDQDTWQVELDGIYQRSSVGAVLQDLQLRYPKQMEQKKLYPTIQGQTSSIKYGKAAWYRLRVAKFATLEDARQLCSLIQHDLQRCQVWSGSTKQVVSTPALKNITEPTPLHETN